MASATGSTESVEDSMAALADAGEGLDMTTFEQVLEMDDDEDSREFSKSIVFDFFTQAESTFEKMDASLASRDLPDLSQLGHFLKGSSATLGLNKVRDSCEKIQNLGAGKDETGAHEEPDTEAGRSASLKAIETSIDEARVGFKEVEKVLRKFYEGK